MVVVEEADQNSAAHCHPADLGVGRITVASAVEVASLLVEVPTVPLTGSYVLYPHARKQVYLDCGLLEQ